MAVSECSNSMVLCFETYTGWSPLGDACSARAAACRSASPKGMNVSGTREHISGVSWQHSSCHYALFVLLVVVVALFCRLGLAPTDSFSFILPRHERDEAGRVPGVVLLWVSLPIACLQVVARAVCRGGGLSWRLLHSEYTWP